MSERMLTVAQVAARRETTHQAAARWLKRHAGLNLRRRGKRLVISARLFAQLNGDIVDDKIGRRIAQIEEDVRLLTARVDALASRQPVRHFD